MSTLSTGPVAVSDKIGGSDVSLIMRSCAADGKLLQPDKPATLTDAAIMAAAKIKQGPSGQIWETYSVLTGYKFFYLLAIESKAYTMSFQELTGSTSGMYVAWETNSSSTLHLFDKSHAISLPDTDKASFNLWTVRCTST